MQYSYETVDMDNNPSWNAEIPQDYYHNLIGEHASNGERYVGWLPVKSGPTGKLLALELVFESE